MSDDPFAWIPRANRYELGFCFGYGKAFDAVLAHGWRDPDAIMAGQKQITVETEWAANAATRAVGDDYCMSGICLTEGVKTALADAAHPLKRSFHAAVVKLLASEAVWQPWLKTAENVSARFAARKLLSRDALRAATHWLDASEPTVELDGCQVQITTVFNRLADFHETLPMFYHKVVDARRIYDLCPTYAFAAADLGQGASWLFGAAADLQRGIAELWMALVEVEP